MTLPPCIYCRRLEVPRTKEHVLQAALGAKAVLQDQVCGDCNSAFSAIDKSFLDALAFYSTGRNYFQSLGLGEMESSDGTLVVVRVLPNGRAFFPPQIYRSETTGDFKLQGSAEEDIDKLRSELAEPLTLKVSKEVAEAKKGRPMVAIIRSAPRTYLVRGTSAEEVDRFATELRTVGLPFTEVSGERRAGPQVPTPVTYQTALRLDPYCRAMCKIALNYVCYRLGPEVTLREAFDAVRAFARHGSGHFADFVVPTVLNHEIKDSLDAFTRAEHHGLFLTCTNEVEAVLIGIEGRCVGRVDLTKGGRSGLPRGTSLLTRFDWQTGTTQDLTLPEDMPRALLNPEVFGLGDIWPKEWRA